jgi:eukaryotic translation initiation factor 2C
MTKALPQLMDLCPNIVFDGSFTLGWSVTEIIPAGAERKTMINLEDHTEARPNQLEVAIRNGGTLNIKKLAQYHQQGQKAKIDSQLQWLNAVFREDPATRFFCKPKGTTYFTRAPGLTMSLQSTGHVLEAIRGIHQSVSTAFGKLSLNVDVACTAFWVQDKPLIDILKAFAGISPQQNFRILDQVTLADALRRLGESGIVFNVKHLNKTANQKQKKITRITADGARTTTFDLKQAGDVHGAQKSTTTSVFDYYREKYQMTLAYPDLPLLVTRDGFFPIELAFAAAGQRYKDVLEGAVTADFIKFATSPAFVREQQTMENVRRLNWSGLAKPATQGLSVCEFSR